MGSSCASGPSAGKLFARAHPQLAETEKEVRPATRILAEFYFFGIDNTPTIDYRSGRIEPALRISWRNFAQMKGESDYKALAGALTARLDAHDGKIVEADRAVFAQFHLADEFDHRWKWHQFSVNNKPK